MNPNTFNLALLALETLKEDTREDEASRNAAALAIDVLRRAAGSSQTMPKEAFLQRMADCLTGSVRELTDQNRQIVEEEVRALAQGGPARKVVVVPAWMANALASRSDWGRRNGDTYGTSELMRQVADLLQKGEKC